jgi:GxxExxY protein
MPSADHLNQLAREIIAAAVAVHRHVGPGCFESVYLRCMEYELQKRNLDVRTNAALTLRYAELSIRNAYQADMIVGDSVIVEVKALECLAPVHHRQLLTYLRLEGLPLGLLLNFGALKLVDGIKRIVNNFPDGTSPDDERSTKPG